MPTPAGVPRRRCGRTRSAGWPGCPSSAELGLGGVLADDMGLGKTVQLLALLVASASRDRAPAPDAAGLPDVAGRQLAARGGAVHPGAAGARAPRRATGRAARTFAAGRWRGADLVITTYARGRPRRRRRCAEVDWHRVVCDEAQNDQERARPGRPGRSAALPAAAPDRADRHAGGEPPRRPVVDHGVRQPRAARHRPRRSGSASPMPIERHGDDEAAAAAAAAHRPVRAAPAQDRQVDHLRPAGQAGDEGLLQPHRASRPRSTRPSSTTCWRRIEDAATASSGAAWCWPRMTKLKQVCNHPAQLLRRRLPAGRPLRQAGPARRDPATRCSRRARRRCCFTQYAEFGADAAAAPGRPARPRGAVPARRHGQERSATRWSPRFQARRTGPPLFLLSLKAGGTGLNLTAANHVVHVDRWWNPAVEDQATDRAFRIGQRRNVQVRKFVCAGTLEEQIDAMIEREEGARRADRRHRRGLADRAVHRGPARPVSPCRADAVVRVMSGRWAGLAAPPRPIRVDGGIRARSKRGAIGERGGRGGSSSVLESFGDERPADPRPQLRPGRAGARLRAVRRARSRAPGAGVTAAARTRSGSGCCR